MFPSPITIDVATSISLPYGCILPEDDAFGSADGACGPVLTFLSTGESMLVALVLILAMVGAVALLRWTWSAAAPRFRRTSTTTSTSTTTTPEFIGFDH